MKPSNSPEIKLLPNECMDRFLEGRLKLIQSKDGYRFSIDAVLLSEFVTIRQGDRVVDLGTGCGVILLLLLLTKPVGHALGIEIQEELATQAFRNAPPKWAFGQDGCNYGRYQKTALGRSISRCDHMQPSVSPKEQRANQSGPAKGHCKA